MGRHLTRSFVDDIKIHVEGGEGGDGCVSFASSPSLPKQGPDGGHGGRGGSVWLVASGRLNTLGSLYPGKTYSAGAGRRGFSQKKKGASGKELFLPVPLGTEVYEERASEQIWLGCLQEEGEKLLVAAGGMNGLGNVAFLSPVEQRPRKASPGKAGVARYLRLSLKIIAHVGLAGFPNAGKSSLLRVCSHAKPKVAPYPFTTLRPHLGIMKVEGARWTIADIPGLKAGAQLEEGFLKHLERTQVLAYVIEVREDFACIEKDFHALRSELRAHSCDLSAKPFLLVLTKMDVIAQGAQRASLVQRAQAELHDNVLMVSAQAGEGVGELHGRLHSLLERYASSVAGPRATAALPRPSFAKEATESVEAERYFAELLSASPQVRITSLDEK